MEENKYMDFIPKMVDLGLPSGTLWADRNVGAEKPEDFGNHYRFGEPEPLKATSPEYRFEDSKEPFEGTDRDPATVHFNRRCHTPSIEQIEELIKHCTQEWTSLNGVNGIRVTGPNGNSIFLPAAGSLSFSSGKAVPYAPGEFGCYWSSDSPCGFGAPINIYDGLFLAFAPEGWNYYNNYMYSGYSVRAVAEKDAFQDLFKR